MPPSPPPPTAPVAPLRPPAFGHLTASVKDTMYPLQTAGFVFASAWVDSASTARHAAALLLSSSGRPFRLTSERQRLDTCAAFVPSLVARELQARDVGLVSLNATPGHTCYGELRRRGGDDVVPLDPATFADLHDTLRRAYRAELSLAEAAELLDTGMQRVLTLLPGKPTGLSRQNLEMLALVVGEPDLTLPQIAERTGLSYDRTSHAVREAVGLSLKSYQCWRKMNDAAELLYAGKSMTEVAHAAGFSDSAHLSRSFRQQLGLSPSYIRQTDCVRIVR